MHRVVSSGLTGASPRRSLVRAWGRKDPIVAVASCSARMMTAPSSSALSQSRRSAASSIRSFATSNGDRNSNRNAPNASTNDAKSSSVSANGGSPNDRDSKEDTALRNDSSVPSSSEKESETSSGQKPGLDRTVYVHPLSHIILEYLQNQHHQWIVAHGLDRSLTIHRDGTFEIKFNDGFEMMPSYAVMDGTDNETKSVNTSDTNAENEAAKHRIWTCFDEVEKKHWLTVHRGEGLHERYLLQDNLVPSWHGNRASLPERIHSAVNDLVRAVHNHSMAHRSLLRLNSTVTKGANATTTVTTVSNEKTTDGGQKQKDP